jgi:hypothetical protein
VSSKGTNGTAQAEPENVVRMADYFDCFATAETERLQLSPKLWVELKKELDEGEASELDEAWMSGFEQTATSNGPLPTEGEVESNVVYHTKFGHWRLMKLALFIVDWNLTGADGKTVRWPRRRQERMQVVAKLSPRIAQVIRGRIDELLLAQRGQEQEAADPSGNPPSASEREPVST